MAKAEQHPKLSRLPQGYHVKKRALVRPPIVSPYNNAKRAKVVYVSAHTPFLSAVKRVRSLQKQIVKRLLGKVSILDGDPNHGKTGRSDVQKLKQISVNSRESEPVYLKGTGRAIAKVLSLAHYFQNQDDCRIRTKTYSIAAVDDIERGSDPEEAGEQDDLMDEDNEDYEMEGTGVRNERAVEVKPAVADSQIRWLSGLEVAVYLQ